MVWNNETKEKLQYAVSIALLLIGTIICIVDFIIPPPGSIHDTSLYFLGEFIAFAGAIFGIGLHYDGQLTKFKQEIKSNLKEQN